MKSKSLIFSAFIMLLTMSTASFSKDASNNSSPEAINKALNFSKTLGKLMPADLRTPEQDRQIIIDAIKKHRKLL